MNVQCAPFLRDSLQVSWDPPPESSFNGILQGYKVISTPDDEWYDADALETKVTTGSNTILSSLLKFTNYSIQVVAFTRVGDGPKSEAVYCNTNEDVPEAPSDIKVISTAVDSVLIAWKPPIRPNGIIKRYTLYKRGLEKDKEDIVKHVLPSTETTFEAKNLVKDRRYEFWVTASTTVGEGQSTPVVSITKSEHIVPAKLISFGGVINAPWKSSLDLPCKAIGIPPPETKWKFQGKSVVNTDVVFIQTDGTLRFKEIHTNNSGNYTCHVANTHGSDQIAYFLKIQVPPAAPKLVDASSTSTSIELHWNHNKESKIPLQGYYLYYKREFGEWSEVSLGPDFDRYVLINLECGTRYQMYIAAVNKLGIGEPSEIITAKTTGEAPIKPKKNMFLREDITFVTLLLEAWASGGCPILYFVVQYKRSSQNDWRLVSNNVLLQQREFIILDLIPATWYAVKVTAHNNAGSTIAEYEFATKTTFGATISPIGSSERNTIKTPLYSDSRFVASILICTFAVIIFIVIICICSKRRRQFRQHKTATDNLTTYTSAQISNCENKELMTYKQKCVPQVYPQIGLRSDFGERTLPGRRHNVHQLQQYPRENYICASDYTTPIPETDILNLNPTQHNLPQPWLIRPSELIGYDQNVPDLLEHGPESCPSNESSPDLHSLESQLRKVQRIQANAREESADLYYPGLRSDPASNETTFIFSHDDSKDAGYEEEEISDAECDMPSFKSDIIKYEPTANPRSNPSPLPQRRTAGHGFEDKTIAV